jgi:hypothetical protein
MAAAMANSTSIPAGLGLTGLEGLQWDSLARMNGWQVAGTVLAILVAYDQCK